MLSRGSILYDAARSAPGERRACVTVPLMTSCAWSPDENLIEYARIAGIDVRKLSPPDRAWVVAGLQTIGQTAEDTARALRCSLRLVRQIRAEPLCIMARYAIALHDRLHLSETTLRRAEQAHARRESALQRDLATLATQRDRLVYDLQRERAQRYSPDTLAV